MTATVHGPAAWEGETLRFGPVGRVAALSDVHGNVPALEAVLADIEASGAELVVFCGDLTWGPDPSGTAALVASLGERAVCVRGNGDRFVGELLAGRPPTTPRERWVPGRHSPEAARFIAGFHFNVVVEIAGLGPVRFCHGSPRSDNELITPGTPQERFRELAAGIDERVLVSGHSHLQFDRIVPDGAGGGWRSVNPGSVGLPYHEGEPGIACWALLGPGVEQRRTRYDVSAAVERSVTTGDPGCDAYTRLLLTPPTPAEIITLAEAEIFAD
jgi:putative phosphoesterase